MVRRTNSGSAGPLWLHCATVLRRDLASGRYLPGNPIPGTEALARRFAVSRGTTRRAVDALKAEGLLDARAGFCTYVRKAPSDEPAPHIIELLHELDRRVAALERKLR